MESSRTRSVSLSTSNVGVFQLCLCDLQGSFASGAFAAYNPSEREVELSEVPTTDDS